MDSSVLLDSLLVASAAGTITLGLRAASNRWWPSPSGHIRHQLTSYSLLLSLGVLVISLVARRGPVALRSAIPESLAQLATSPPGWG